MEITQKTEMIAKMKSILSVLESMNQEGNLGLDMHVFQEIIWRLALIEDEIIFNSLYAQSLKAVADIILEAERLSTQISRDQANLSESIESIDDKKEAMNLIF